MSEGRWGGGSRVKDSLADIDDCVSAGGWVGATESASGAPLDASANNHSVKLLSVGP